MHKTIHPIVAIHGVFHRPRKGDWLNNLTEWVEADYPGTIIYALDAYHGMLNSAMSLDLQIKEYTINVEEIMKAHEAITIIGFSQGAIIAMAIAEALPNHKIHTMICVCGPMAGLYGVSTKLDFLGPIQTFLVNNFHYLIYSRLGQKISLCNCWHDPQRYSDFLKYNKILPYLLNLVDHPQQEEYKRNFCRLKKLVLVGSEIDGVVQPWQSAHFGFYDQNLELVQMRNQEFYVFDTFGLQTLDKKGAVIAVTMKDLIHEKFCLKRSDYETAVFPYL